VKNQSGNIKLSNVKKKKKSLPTYPPADSVGWQCQTNNILRVALGVSILPLSTISIFDFGILQTMWYFLLSFYCIKLYI
jgi:hypothetical protein